MHTRRNHLVSFFPTCLVSPFHLKHTKNASCQQINPFYTTGSSCKLNYFKRTRKKTLTNRAWKTKAKLIKRGILQGNGGAENWEKIDSRTRTRFPYSARDQGKDNPSKYHYLSLSHSVGMYISSIWVNNSL